MGFNDKQIPLIDVRSPSEFAKGHIPGAISFPLFSDQERHEVGTCYKQVGKAEAIKLGLHLVSPKFSDFVKRADEIAPDKIITAYCWRGGMRSGSIAWLLKNAGFDVKTIKGGYKAWRNESHALFGKNWRLINISGFTGTGKTEILRSLANLGEQVIDLEGLANHKGSAFGNLGQQPTTEHFENLLGWQFMSFDSEKPIWVEDESRAIGQVYLPLEVRQQMLQAKMILIQRAKEERIAALCDDYGKVDKPILIENFERLDRRLGGQNVKRAIDFINEGNLPDACEIALDYYDKTYAYSLEKTQRAAAQVFEVSGQTNERIAELLIQWKHENLPNTATAQGADAK
ncbi:MAG: tRNA 2-selenouridine(34) synthase MnmH [Flavobacteriales bacterium]